MDKAKYNTTKHNEIVLKWTDENKGVSASSSNNITPYKLLSASAQETFTGDLSETVHWKFVMNPLLEKGTLIVYGTGAIPDYSDSALNKPSYFKYSRQVTDIIIEEGITGIGTYAFDKMYATGVSFPESLTTIKTFAFRNNTFSTLTIPKNCNQISASAFKYCKIKNLIFEEGVEKVLLDSFYNDGNDVVSELNLPSTLKEFLFRNNPSFSSGTIKKVNIKNNDIYYTKDDILYKKLSDGTSELVLYPEAKNDITEYTVPDNVSAISANAVINNIFEKITVGDNVKSIGENFGGNCFSLKEAVLPQKVTINTFGLFKNCSSLRKFNLPENINVRFPYVSDYVYNSLEEINLPDGITGLDPNVFSNMPNLKKLLYDIPDCNSFNNIKITDSPNFELTVGKKVNHLYGRQDGLSSYDFRSVLAHSENVLFEGENQITIDSKTFENMPVPLKYLEGTVWVDSQGIVYKYDSDKQTAEVAYVPYGRESIIVPETIKPKQVLSAT